MNVYFISGLGADDSAFCKIGLMSHYKIIHLPWIIPYEDEFILDYALRMSNSIDKNQPFILIGLSFGGIIAKEIATLHNPEKIIIISSMSNSNQMPWYFKFIATIKFHKWIPVHWLKIPNPITNWFFGIKSEDEKLLMSKILRNTNIMYLKWAINALLNWKNNKLNDKIIHLHGSEDRIIPLRYVKPNYIIEGGRHFMVLSKHKAVNDKINYILN